MKKMFALILTLSLILSAFALADYDISDMSDQELMALISACSTELRARNLFEPDGILICNEGGFRIYQIGEAYISNTGRIEIPVLIYNDLDVRASISTTDTTCNDFNCFGYLYSTMSPHSKVKDKLDFSTEGVGLTSFDDIYSLIFRWYVYSQEDSSVNYESAERLEYRFW